MVAKRCTLRPLFFALLLRVENVLEGIIVSRVSSTNYEGMLQSSYVFERKVSLIGTGFKYFRW